MAQSYLISAEISGNAKSRALPYFQKNFRKLLQSPIDEFMAGQALLWEGDFSWAEMAAGVNKEYGYAPGVPTGDGCRKHCMKVGWTDTRQRILPWLSEDHLKRRAAWASLYVKQKWLAWVDVDEKWFYTLKLHGRRKQAPGQKLPPRFCKHKAHIPKVMFLAATARPRPGFDGKVGIWRVAAPETAKKISKNHNKDDVYDEDVTMTSEHYFTMMTTVVFKGHCQGLPWHRGHSGDRAAGWCQASYRQGRGGTHECDRCEALADYRGAHAACPEPRHEHQRPRAVQGSGRGRPQVAAWHEERAL